MGIVIHGNGDEGFPSSPGIRVVKNKSVLPEDIIHRCRFPKEKNEFMKSWISDVLRDARLHKVNTEAAILFEHRSHRPFGEEG